MTDTSTCSQNVTLPSRTAEARPWQLSEAQLFRGWLTYFHTIPHIVLPNSTPLYMSGSNRLIPSGVSSEKGSLTSPMNPFAGLLQRRKTAELTVFHFGLALFFRVMGLAWPGI